ncbi:hypothetical protein ACFL1H_01490 [Nanoarchaeota archaeon]
MFKKGQMGLFIIVAVVIIILGIFIFYYIPSQSNNINVNRGGLERMDTASQALFNMIDDCMDDVTYDALYEIGQKGGYFDVPADIEVDEIPYWFIDEANLQPSFMSIESQLEDYVTNNFMSCVNYSGFEEMGFIIEDTVPTCDLLFSQEDVVTDLNYSIVIRDGDLAKAKDDFRSTMDFGFRKLYELSHRVILLNMDPIFEFNHPTRYVNWSGFDIEFELINDTVKYHIYDLSEVHEREGRENYSFSFATRHEKSFLKRTIKLHEDSHVVPILVTTTLFSPDRMVEIIIPKGTMISKDGSAVDEITIYQLYPEDVSISGVVIGQSNDNGAASHEYGNYTWDLKHPVYIFHPEGLKFNNPVPITVYWDEDRIPVNGSMGMLYFKEDFGWYPVPAEVDYEEFSASSLLPGFSGVTLEDCGDNEYTTVTSTTSVKPKFPCTLLLIINIVMIAALIVALSGLGASGLGSKFLATVDKIGLGNFQSLSTTVTEKGVSHTFSKIARASLKALKGSKLGALKGHRIFTWTILTLFYVSDLLGIDFLSGLLWKEGGEDCVAVLPLCDQPVTFEKSSSNGDGQCSMDGTQYLKGGFEYKLCAGITSCDKGSAFLCKKCSVTCTAKYVQD